MKRPISDLPFCFESKRIVIVQPQLLTGTNWTPLKENKFNKVGNDTFQEIFDSILNLYLNHVGSLSCDNYNRGSSDMPISFKPCRGMLTITAEQPNSDFSWLKKSGWKKSFITCSRCSMTLASNQELPELQNAIFHLMLKQMFPMLNSCNYVACDQKQPDSLLNKEDLNKIQELGMVAVASKIFLGIIDNGFFPKFQEHYSLGFMLMPGMNTLNNGFDGFDEWVKFLFSKKMEQLEEIQKSIRSSILGPKSVKKS